MDQRAQEETKIKVAGRVLAIASFHSEALFTSFARQTDEPENSSERETLRFRVRRPKRRKCDVCAFFFSLISHPYSYVATAAQVLLRCSLSDSSHSLDFCLFPSPRFYPLLYFSTFFLACTAVAQRKCCLYVSFVSIVLELVRKRDRGRRKRKREKISE